MVGIVIFETLHKEYLRITDFEKYVEDYLRPEEVRLADKYLRRGPMRIIIP